LPTPERYWIGGLIAVAAVLVLVVLPFRQFQQSGQDPKPWTPTPEIVVAGAFKFTRNPMYLGMIVFCLGFAIILSDVWILILTPVCGWLIYHLAIRHEEDYLEEKFGESYRAYKATVRRWI
jgi:protein-S-isoprenylcysteine O-methyltransferase Ste14